MKIKQFYKRFSIFVDSKQSCKLSVYCSVLFLKRKIQIILGLFKYRSQKLLSQSKRRHQCTLLPLLTSEKRNPCIVFWCPKKKNKINNKKVFVQKSRVLNFAYSYFETKIQFYLATDYNLLTKVAESTKEIKKVH